STPAETIRLRDYYFNPCIGCEQCRKNNRCSGQNDAMHLMYPKVIESQGLILVSPTHHYNITAWMKAFIDRLYCFYEFGNDVPRSWSSRLSGQNRKAAIIAICEQENKSDMGFTREAMRLPLEALGYEIVDELAVFKIFKRGAVKENNQVVERVAEIAETMARSIS
nr:flavodoxin family protein [Spirochaeta sp.]